MKPILGKSTDACPDKGTAKQEKHAKSINKIVNSRLDYLEASIEKVDKRLAYNMELLKEAD